MKHKLTSEDKKKRIESYANVLKEMYGGPGSGPHKEGEGGGDKVSDKDFSDPEKWNKLTTKQQQEKGRPAGKARNGKSIKNGDEVHYLIGNHTSSSPGGIVLYKDPNDGLVTIRDYTQSIQVVDPKNISTEPFTK